MCQLENYYGRRFGRTIIGHDCYWNDPLWGSMYVQQWLYWLSSYNMTDITLSFQRILFITHPYLIKKIILSLSSFCLQGNWAIFSHTSSRNEAAVWAWLLISGSVAHYLMSIYLWQKTLSHDQIAVVVSRWLGHRPYCIFFCAFIYFINSLYLNFISFWIKENVLHHEHHK